jgi:hypothetical protein
LNYAKESSYDFVKPNRFQQLVKADQPTEKDISVLKLYQEFYNGIYPYSMMTSSFLPVYESKHALKIVTSIQEWCGQVFVQLENRMLLTFKYILTLKVRGNNSTPKRTS